MSKGQDYNVEVPNGGLTLDEGEGIGGDLGLCKQSLRSELYSKAVAELRKSKAYRAFDTPDELNALRKDAESRNEVFDQRRAASVAVIYPKLRRG